MSTVTEHRRRAARAAFEQVYSPDSASPETPSPEPGEPTCKYLSDWQRDATCQTCGSTFEQLNYGLAAMARPAPAAFAIAGVCTSSSERLRSSPVRFENRWIPSGCPACEAARMAAEEELRRDGAYLKAIRSAVITFEPDEAVLVLDSMEELSDAVLGNLRAAGKLSVAIGCPLETWRAALGEEQFARLLAEGKIISSEIISLEGSS